MQYLTRLVVALFLLSASLPAFAQDVKTRLVIGGVDQRVPPLQIEHLARQLAEKGDQLARAVALLSVEKADHQDAEGLAAGTRAWLDQAWREMEYWRAFSGHAAAPVRPPE